MIRTQGLPMRARALPLCLTALLLTACAAAPAVEPAPGGSASPTARPSPVESTPITPPTTPAPAPPPESEPGATPGTPGQVAVTIADFTYAPDPIEIAVGGSVTWTNADSTAHTATVSGGGPNTGAIRGGASASLVFDTAGTFTYVCQFHPGSMTGTIVVR